MWDEKQLALLLVKSTSYMLLPFNTLLGDNGVLSFVLSLEVAVIVSAV